MKKIILFLYCLCCCSAFCTNAKNAYYYYNGERTPITISEDSIRIYSINNLRTSHDGEKDIVTMNVNNLHNGIYFLALKVHDEILSSKKMIINH